MAGRVFDHEKRDGQEYEYESEYELELESELESEHDYDCEQEHRFAEHEWWLNQLAIRARIDGYSGAT